ncbi:hypothetical protein IDJ77_04650 [Mucilaginibacter sp. ZT4R22]|uniref:NHL repeat-containing protein n=1 Tax=Mucilaginibacter pankratovii TaxID=2772110 RepID=A0ABR7WLT3_9SPHI|nr:hypothetical protein [Mucilaginibacter pankratovii]MBD1363093.1 hypothetical protein [Mucilaginibacter pankratovii]
MKIPFSIILLAGCLAASCTKEATPVKDIRNLDELALSKATIDATTAPYTVRTIAGIFEPSSSDPHLVNGPGLKAKFWKPHGITVDGDGSIYVADFFNSAIRKITVQNNVYTEPLSYNPDTGGGLLPEAVGISPGGTLYIVSTGYGIRIYNKEKGIDVYDRIANSDSNLDLEKDSKGVMWFVSDVSLGKITGTTIQRNVVNFSSLLAPNESLRGIGTGPNGVKYVSTATQLFKITNDGKITRLFQNERFVFISGIAVTKDGNTIYLAEGNKIKKIVGNTITTICGPLSAADGRDGVGAAADVVAANLALSNSETALFVSDTRNTIRKITLQ